jgi:3-phenylpropionate/trans-cinnamate dioxygenase ferredoxin reductase subunit
MNRVVLIGAGQTSASAARALRREGFGGEVVIVGEEPHPPYQRPPLSKEYLQGAAPLSDVWSVDPAWYDENKVELRLGIEAKEIDRGSREVVLDDGSRIQGDAVLIATGGRARRLPEVEGERILYLRNLDDCERLRSYLGPDQHLVVVGAGFIGSEVSASARAAGARVTVLEALEQPMERVLGKELGAVTAAVHRYHGVDLRTRTGMESIEETSQGVVVRPTTGEGIEGDAVVVGIGMQPNVEIARVSEITVGNGIRVDEFCRTSLEGVFAAGDVANHYHPIFDRRMRVEHFDNATRHGTAAARNMLGIRTPYVDAHWFWSDQYDHSYQYVGHAEKWDATVVRGSIEDREFVVFYMLDGLVEAAFAMDRGADVLVAKSLITERRRIDPSVLADEDQDLGELLVPPEPEVDPVPVGPEALGTFVRAARSGQVPEGIVRRFEVEGVELAIARYQGRAFALHNLCTHLACHLASGKVDNGGLICLCHGSVFDLATGEPTNPPATRPVRTYPVKEENGQVYVSLR